ncbi:MAG: hypothetical protein ACI9FN_003722 [Saprospiraceae bacterium]
MNGCQKIFLIFECNKSNEKIDLFVQDWLVLNFDIQDNFCQSRFLDRNEYCENQINHSGVGYFGEALDPFIQGYKIVSSEYMKMEKEDIVLTRIKSMNMDNTYLILEFNITNQKLNLIGVEYEL